MFSNLKISVKLPLIFLLVSLIAATSVGISGYIVSANEVVKLSRLQLQNLAEGRRTELSNYFERLAENIRFVASSDQTKSALKDFSSAWSDLRPQERQEIKRVYVDENPFPPKFRYLMSEYDSGTSLDDIHNNHNKWFVLAKDSLNYRDVLLIDLEGNVVFSNLKSAEFGANLNDSKFKNTPIFDSYSASLDSIEGQVTYSDIVNYGESPRPSAFISAPIIENAEVQGVIVFSIPVENINAIVNGVNIHELDSISAFTEQAELTDYLERIALTSGLGKTGESFILDEKGRFLSDSRFTETNDTLSSKLKDAQTLLLENETGRNSTTTEAHRSLPLYAEVIKFELGELSWFIITIKSVAEIKETLNQTLFQMIGIGTLLFLLSGVVGVVVSRSFSNPIQQLTKNAQLISQGDLTTKLDGIDRADELGDIARAINQFRTNVEQQFTLSEERDAETKLQMQRQKQIDESIVTFRNGIKDIFKNLMTTTDTLESSSTSLFDIADRTANGAKEVSEQTESTINNMHSVSSAMSGLTNSIDKVSNLINSTGDSVQKSSQTAGEATNKVALLKSSTTEISDTVELIRDIAEQTNILALNASIEAAKSGVHGQAFGVVAQEVKSLAEVTSGATEEITKRIESIKLSSDDVDAIIDQMISSINEVHSSMNNVTAALNDQIGATKIIEQSIEATTSSTNHVTSGISKMNEDAHLTSVSAEGVKDSSSTVTKYSNELNKTIDTFLKSVSEI